MKKLSYVFLFNIIIAVFVSIFPKGLDSILFGVVPVIFIFLLLPFVSGILLILVQNKNRSYEFLPVLLLGTCINNVLVILITYSIESSRHGYLYKPQFDFYTLLNMFLPFIALSLFGGLIGLVIRGTTLLVRKHK